MNQNYFTKETFNDFNDSNYTAVKLLVTNGHNKSYVFFADNQSGVQVVECSGCPKFKKVDSSNYQITF